MDTLITVKADLASIGTSAAGGIGNLIKVDPLNFEGTGASSGSTVRGGATAGVAGVRLFKSYPTFALDTLPGSGVSDGRLIRFKVTSNAAGPIGISQFTFTVSTTSANPTSIQLFGFTSSDYATPVSGQGSGGQIASTVATTSCGSTFDTSDSTCRVGTSLWTIVLKPSTILQVNGTNYFELREIGRASCRERVYVLV